MVAVRIRQSPSASATGFPEGTRKRGNDGRTWEVSVTSAGVRRWRPVVAAAAAAAGSSSRRTRRTPTKSSAPSVFVFAVLPIVLDDLLGNRSQPAPKPLLGLSRQSAVPPAAAAILRRRIRSNDFQFEFLLDGIPLMGGGRSRAKLHSFELIEKGPKWWVELRWRVAADERVSVNALRDELWGQLSDGWGEGVEQFRFGPVVDCLDDDYQDCRVPASAARRRELEKAVDLNGRFAFNLTTYGSSIGILASK